MDLASKWMQQVAQSRASRVHFLDWENKEIACVDVPKHLKGEERLAYLNAYVRDNLIHPDLRRANLASLKRKDTYRGKYPYVHGKNDPAYIRKNGENFPLTNKLDYRFVTGKQMPQPDGTVRIEDDPDDPYPYLRGFITVINTADPPWTTFGGAGELSRFSHRFPDGRIAGYNAGGAIDRGLGYMQYPDGTAIYCNGWADLKQKGGGDSVTTKSDDAEAVPLDDGTPLMFAEYDIAPAESTADRTSAETPIPLAASDDDDEMIEVPDDELENLYALRDRWQECVDIRDAFLTEMGKPLDVSSWSADSLKAAVREASSERLGAAVSDILIALGLQWQTVDTVARELVRRVLATEAAVNGSAEIESAEV